MSQLAPVHLFLTPSDGKGNILDVTNSLPGYGYLEARGISHHC